MHRLHLASRWDCPPVYFQGTLRCEAPSWAASCLLYPQQQQQAVAASSSSRLGDSGEALPRSLSTRSLPRSQASLLDSQASSLFASSSTCYIPSRPSSPVSFSFDISSPRLVLRSPEHPSSPSPSALQRPPCAHSLRPPSNQATLVRPVKVYPRVTKSSLHPCRRHLEAKRLPPTTPLCPPASSTALGLPLLQLAGSKRSRLQPSRDHFFPKNPESLPVQILNCLPPTFWQNSMLSRQTTSQLTAHFNGQTWLLPKLTEEAFRWRTRASAW